MTRQIMFPRFSGLRCLMMPYIQGDAASVPDAVAAPYRDILNTVYVEKGDVGYLTIDESWAVRGRPHRGAHAKHGRALHTEAGWRPRAFQWGDGPAWGSEDARAKVSLDRHVRVLVANSLDQTCAVWRGEHVETTRDGDIGHLAGWYPYRTADLMGAGEVREIGILTPHESLPVSSTGPRQFLRIVSSGVHGREEYFTENPLALAGCAR